MKEVVVKSLEAFMSVQHRFSETDIFRSQSPSEYKPIPSICRFSCCRGRLMEVTYDNFLTCQQICNVLGSRQSLASADMHICFGIFLYNMEIRGVDPIVACEKIKLATDQRFSCYDRQEESISLENYNYMHMGYE